MKSLLDKWRGLSLRTRVISAVVLVLVTAGAAVAAYEILKRPADISNNDVAFEEEAELPKPPKGNNFKTVNWPTYGYGNDRNRYFPTKSVVPPFASSDWSFQSGKLLEFPPVIVDDRLFVADIDGLMYSLNAQTGKPVWKRSIGTRGASSAAYSEGKLYAVTLEPGQATALRAKDGKILWQRDLPGRSESSPLVYQKKLVIFGCECGTVFGLDIKDGSIEWTVETGGAIKGGLAEEDGVVFGGNYAGEAFAIDASSGDEKWRVSTSGGSFGRGGGIYSTPATAYGRVYFGSIDSRVYSLDQDNGQIAWSQSTGAEVYGSPAIADTPGTPPTVYIGSADGNFYALDAQSGSIRWSKGLGGDITGSATVLGDVVYTSVIGDSIGTFGLDVKDGSEKFENEIGEYSPVVSDGKRMYLIGYSNVRAFAPKSLVKARKKAKRERREFQKAKKEAKKEAAGDAEPEGEEPEGEQEP